MAFASFPMNKLSCLLCSCLVLLSACKRKETVAPAAPVAVAPPPSSKAAVEQPAVAPPNAPAAPAPATPSPVEEPSTNVSAEHFGILSQGLLTFRRDKHRAPRDWQELISTGYLKQMPVAPPGRRYIFNPASLDVQMVTVR